MWVGFDFYLISLLPLGLIITWGFLSPPRVLIICCFFKRGFQKKGSSSPERTSSLEAQISTSSPSLPRRSPLGIAFLGWKIRLFLPLFIHQGKIHPPISLLMSSNRLTPLFGGSIPPIREGLSLKVGASFIVLFIAGQSPRIGGPYNIYDPFRHDFCLKTSSSS